MLSLALSRAALICSGVRTARERSSKGSNLAFGGAVQMEQVRVVAFESGMTKPYANPSSGAVQYFGRTVVPPSVNCADVKLAYPETRRGYPKPSTPLGLGAFRRTLLPGLVSRS